MLSVQEFLIVFPVSALALLAHKGSHGSRPWRPKRRIRALGDGEVAEAALAGVLQ